MAKKFIPCIYLNNNILYTDKSLQKSFNVNPGELVLKYSEAGADEILIYDLSITDEDREGSLNTIIEMSKVARIPLLGYCKVKKMEDVKKLLYAGCKRAIVSLNDGVSNSLIEEVGSKFGSEKIVIEADNDSFDDDTLNVIKKYSYGFLLTNESLAKNERICSSKKPLIVNLKDVSLDKILEYINLDSVCAITGDTLNDNISELYNIKLLAGEKPLSFKELKTDDKGLIPVIVQDYKSNEVLMLAYMNEEAYEKTIRTHTMTYFSRSRQSLWVKGETSGHFQYVKALSYDCDNDTLLAKVEQIGAACHTGNKSCFYRDIISYDYEEKNPLAVLDDVYNVILDRKVHPKEGSYTNYLFDKGIDKILKKVGEEATEIVIAAKNPNVNEIKYEVSDFLYHVMVLMALKGVTWEEIMTELANR